ncbi:hypothetical protein SG34_006020 [Thalassomonas viridans]|uniref:Uncharacterized protein n=1 Tax=Thalassomonas viridans TaxID=137584 RepID=A0AAE9Z5J5_9GAMM|nr:hypothetical protein [Thalassomonas viridans]WDE06474.1 hypothetical protein SG34_006020 [Thalassomonas viridans]
MLDGILTVLGIAPLQSLGESMRSSKTLTIMVVTGLVLFGGFVLFLYKIAGMQ